jgi:hypothetical protein
MQNQFHAYSPLNRMGIKIPLFTQQLQPLQSTNLLYFLHYTNLIVYKIIFIVNILILVMNILLQFQYYK